jgi:hypothetical protein
MPDRKFTKVRDPRVFVFFMYDLIKCIFQTLMCLYVDALRYARHWGGGGGAGPGRRAAENRALFRNLTCFPPQCNTSLN